MRIVIHCGRCKHPITPALDEQSKPSSTGDEAAYVGAGRFVRVGGDDVFGDHPGWIAVHLADAAAQTKPHKDDRRRVGCCGCDGLDGNNVTCAKGHEVGVEKSDCWMPHAVLFDPERTKIEMTRD